MNRIAKTIKINPEAVFSMYEGMIPPTVSAETLPNYLYGTYNSLAVTIFNLVPAITTSIGISALPAVAEAWALKDRKMTGENIETVLKITAMVAIPAGLGLFTFAGPILNVLYGNNPKEVLVATPLLTMMGISVIFTALTTPLYNMLQGVGRADLPVWFILFGGLLKLTGNYILVGIPEINIKGAPIGTLLCYAFIAVASVIALMRITGCSLRFGKTFLGPLISSVLCCTGSYLLYRFISLMVGKITLYPSRLLMACQLAICIIFAVVVYIFSLLTTKSVTKNDILMLPKGEKIAKTLEKLKVME
jgi:stage V sporulation protein B